MKTLKPSFGFIRFAVFFLLFIILLSFELIAQVNEGDGNITYTLLYNVVPDRFRYPLVGVVNQAKGSHNNLQIGVYNRTQNDFKGAQFGFINNIGGKTEGAHFGFVNVVQETMKGASFAYVNIYGKETEGVVGGFVNITGESMEGAQLGFVNITAEDTEGAQIGFVNITGGKVNGPQIGFVNLTGEEIKGLQIGFVNASKKTVDGPQIGFINATSRLNGLQLGFLNFSDTLESGVPIGFLSFVKKGGYRALEASVNESFPVNLAFKTGIKKIYSNLVFSFNPDFEPQYYYGVGLGSILPISPKVYVNPELMYQASLQYNQFENHRLNSLTINFAYKVSDAFDLLLGPSAVLNYGNAINEPLFSLYSNSFNDGKKSLVLGARFALRYNLTSW